MTKYSAIFKAECLQRPDLRFLLGGDAVHCRYHRENGNGKEKHGQYGAHRFSFLRFAHSLFVNDVIVLRRYHDRSAERVFYPVLQRFL